ncbi:MAG: hypothetical protein PHN77_17600, partial [Thermoguttaceae bacterium]|nr:hypothetical protein [Thermoguttaceae bacterium]
RAAPDQITATETAEITEHIFFMPGASIRDRSAFHWGRLIRQIPRTPTCPFYRLFAETLPMAMIRRARFPRLFRMIL